MVHTQLIKMNRCKDKNRNNSKQEQNVINANMSDLNKRLIDEDGTESGNQNFNNMGGYE